MWQAARLQQVGCAAGTQLVRRAIEEMAVADADEVVLEAEVTNRGALALYQNLGFLRDKRLLRFTLHWDVRTMAPSKATTCTGLLGGPSKLHAQATWQAMNRAVL